MPPRKRLIVHIGMHKTGTSALQQLLARERGALAARGICYPHTDRPPFPNRRKHRSLWGALVAGPKAFAREKARLLAEFAASGADTLVLSEEGLSSPRLGLLEPMRSFADVFEVEVVCLLRRQDRFLEGFWNQRCKTGLETRHIDAFVRAPGPRARIDYAALLAFWSGFARVIALDFRQARAAGLVAQINAATGLDLPPQVERHNPSPSMRCAAIMAGLNRRGTAHDWRRIEAALDAPGGRHALGSRLRGKILAGCAAQNAVLAQRHGVRFSDCLPEEPAAPLPRPDAAELDRFAALA